MLSLAATYADLWNAEGPVQWPEEISSRRAAGDAACAAVGRDPATLGRSASVVVNLPLAQGQGQQRSLAVGEQPASHEEIAQMLRNYAQQGLSHVQLRLSPNTIAALEWLAPALNLLDYGEA